METYLDYNKECKEIIDKWGNPLIPVPHQIFFFPENGGDNSNELILEMAKSFLKRSGSRRDFGNSFITLKYPTDEKERMMFFDSPRIVAEYYNHFSGVFAIDISEHVETTESKAFEELLRYVIENEAAIQFIFIVKSEEKRLKDVVYDILNTKIRTGRLDIEYYDAKVYAKFAVKGLKEQGLIAEKGIEDVLRKNIEALSVYSDFSGQKSISRLIEDIVFEAHSEKQLQITKKWMIDFIERYVEEKNTILRTYKKIGF